MNMLRRLWDDQSGAVVSAELVIIATILVLGMIVGLTTVRDQVVQELGDLALAIASINQSYSFSGVTGHHSSTAGSQFVDLLDDCNAAADVAGGEPSCIELAIAATPEG